MKCDVLMDEQFSVSMFNDNLQTKRITLWLYASHEAFRRSGIVGLLESELPLVNNVPGISLLWLWMRREYVVLILFSRLFWLLILQEA